MKNDPVITQLKKFNKIELRKMASELSIDAKDSWNVKQLAFAIRRRQLDNEKLQQPEITEQQPLQDSGDFVQAMTEEEPPKETRGGARPGAGRPAGMTNEKAAVKNLPQQPNNTIKQALEMPFKMWASRNKLPELGLAEEESHQLALVVTQLQEYYAPGAIPEIAWTWVGLVTTIYAIGDTRIRIIREARKQRHGNDTGKTGQQSSDRLIGVGQNQRDAIITEEG